MIRNTARRTAALLVVVTAALLSGCVYYLGGYDTSLATLEVREEGIDFEFDPDVTTYTVTVPATLETVTIDAVPADEDAVVTGTGKHDLTGELTVVTVLVELWEQVYDEYEGEDRKFTTEYTIIFTKDGTSGGTGGNQEGVDADSYEPDDTAETASAYIGESQDHTIHSRTDVDYISIDVVDYLSYTVKLETIDGFYPELALVREGEIIDSITPFIDSWNEQLAYTPESDGTLYVRVASTYQAELFASYTLSITTEVVPLEVPTGLTAGDAEYDNRILLTWTATSDAVSYEIYRSTNGTDFVYTGTSTTASYEDVSSGENPLSSGTTYTYKVRGVKNEEAKSEFSDPDEGSIAGLGVISDLEATVINGTVRLSWSLLPDENIVYAVYAAEGESGSYGLLSEEADPIIDPDTGSALYDMETAQPDIEYYFKIVPEKEGVVGEDSNTATGLIPFASYKPMAPNATNSAVLQIRITWEPVGGATGYQLYRADENMENDVKIGDFAADKTSYTDTDVDVGIYYNYAIIAVKDGTTSSMSYYDNGIAVSK